MKEENLPEGTGKKRSDDLGGAFFLKKRAISQKPRSSEETQEETGSPHDGSALGVQRKVEKRVRFSCGERATRHSDRVWLCTQRPPETSLSASPPTQMAAERPRQKSMARVI